MSKKTISIGNDHAGTEYKFEIIKILEEKGYEVLNFGTDTDASMDYPDTIHPAASAVEQGRAQLGIILCGSGTAQLLPLINIKESEPLCVGTTNWWHWHANTMMPMC